MKYLFVINPKSGGFRPDLPETIRRNFSAGEYDVVFTEYAGHAERLARETDADAVVAVGGDGTVNEVARGIIGSGKALGVIPCGSGDGLALHLGFSRNPRKAVTALNGARVEPMDAGYVNGHSFFCTCGVGLDADVSMMFAGSSRRGLVTYIVDAFKVWAHFKPGRYKIIVDGAVHEEDAVLITVGNAGQWGNNAFITPQASVSDGLLDVTVVKRFGSLCIPSLAFALMTGGIDRHRKVTALRGRSVSIVRDRPGAAHFDGEPVEMGSELEIGLQPGGLNVLVPRGIVRI